MQLWTTNNNTSEPVRFADKLSIIANGSGWHKGLQAKHQRKNRNAIIHPKESIN